MNGLRAGAAQVEITPPAGTSMTGYILRDGPSLGVHDPLYARALVFDDGTDQAAIVVCDVLALDRHFVASARASIAEAAGIPVQSILVASTHTHSGPATISLRDCGTVAEAWLEELHGRLVELVREAVGCSRPARIGAGYGQVASGVENRRARGGPTDPEVGILRVEDHTGEPLAVLVNYACHPTFLGHDNRLISADYPGYALARIRDRTRAIALFATGAGGDVGPVPEQRRAYNPIDATSEPAADCVPVTRSAFKRAEALGTALADEALRVLPAVTTRDTGHVRVASTTLQLPLQPPLPVETLEQFAADHRRLKAEAQAASQSLRAKVHGAMLGWAESTLGAIRTGQVMTEVPAEAQVICLEGILLVGVPGEPFVDVGRAIKAQAPAEHVFVIGYANDDIGYIPTREEYGRGGYEIDDAYKYYGYPAALAPEAGEAFVASVLRLIDDFRA